MVAEAAGLARAIQQTGWDVVVEFYKEGARGEFAVYLDHELLFSRIAEGRSPDPQEIVAAIGTRLSGSADKGER